MLEAAKINLGMIFIKQNFWSHLLQLCEKENLHKASVQSFEVLLPQELGEHVAAQCC